MTQGIRWVLLQFLRCLICILTGKRQKKAEAQEETDENVEKKDDDEKN